LFERAVASPGVSLSKIHSSDRQWLNVLASNKDENIVSSTYSYLITHKTPPAEMSSPCKYCVPGQLYPEAASYWTNGTKHTHCNVVGCKSTLKRFGYTCECCHHPNCGNDHTEESYFCSDHYCLDMDNTPRLATTNMGRTNLSQDIVRPDPPFAQGHWG
jgi:hypothetical protein